MRAEIYKVIKLIRYAFMSKSNKVILIDTPIHGNIGDSAIALAEEKMLENNGIDFIELVANDVSDLEWLYAKCTPISCKILVHGGGFLGSVWKNEEFRFRRIIKAFYKHQIIVLPQTIYFNMKNEADMNFFRESKEIYESHNKLTIFVREENSLLFMKKNMPSISVKLVPDIVLSLIVENLSATKQGILFCFRKDYEKSIDSFTIDYITRLISNKFPNEKIIFTDTVIPMWIKKEMRNEIVTSKINEFSFARLIITDRLQE